MTNGTIIHIRPVEAEVPWVRTEAEYVLSGCAQGIPFRGKSDLPRGGSRWERYAILTGIAGVGYTLIHIGVFWVLLGQTVLGASLSF